MNRFARIAIVMSLIYFNFIVMVITQYKHKDNVNDNVNDNSNGGNAPQYDVLSTIYVVDADQSDKIAFVDSTVCGDDTMVSLPCE